MTPSQNKKNTSVFVIVFRLAGQSRDYVISKATEENELPRSKLRDIKNTRGGLPLDMSPRMF
jgi:hypothetical protein